MTGVLHLNTLNPLLRHLRDLGPQHESFSSLLSILIANARMFSGQNLSAQDTIQCFEQINRSLAQLSGLHQAADPQASNVLNIEDLTSLGISTEAASRLCAQCETISALLAADLDTLARQARISPLLLATVREELSHRA